MFLPLLMAFALPISLAPIRTHQVFAELYALESLQIDADNLAIRLGQNDRSFYRSLERWKKIINKLEIAHHVSHLCARVPATAIKCLPLDVKLEKSLQVASLSAKAELTYQWHRGTSLGGGSVVGRSMIPPFDMKRCRQCGKKVRLELKQEYQSGHKYRVERVGEDLVAEAVVQVFESEEDQWNYRIDPNP